MANECHPLDIPNLTPSQHANALFATATPSVNNAPDIQFMPCRQITTSSESTNNVQGLYVQLQLDSDRKSVAPLIEHVLSMQTTKQLKMPWNWACSNHA